MIRQELKKEALIGFPQKSLKILKCSMMGYNSYAKVMLVYLPKHSPSRTTFPGLYNLISH